MEIADTNDDSTVIISNAGLDPSGNVTIATEITSLENAALSALANAGLTEFLTVGVDVSGSVFAVVASASSPEVQTIGSPSVGYLGGAGTLSVVLTETTYDIEFDPATGTTVSGSGAYGALFAEPFVLSDLGTDARIVLGSLQNSSTPSLDTTSFASVNVVSVPEPSTLALATFGLLVLIGAGSGNAGRIPVNPPFCGTSWLLNQARWRLLKDSRLLGRQGGCGRFCKPSRRTHRPSWQWS